MRRRLPRVTPMLLACVLALAACSTPSTPMPAVSVAQCPQRPAPPAQVMAEPKFLDDYSVRAQAWLQSVQATLVAPQTK